jgi:cytochrome d ubiquinol oxidase subunit I
MVGLGTAMALVALLGAALSLRHRRLPDERWYLWAVVLVGPAGFGALEAGWMVTEWGRQPFTVWGVMRTADSVTSVPDLAVPFWGFMALYVFLGLVTAAILRRQIAHAPLTQEAGATP